MTSTRYASPSYNGKIKAKAFRYIQILLCTLLTIGCVFPLIWLVDFSLVKANELFGKNFLVWPKKPHWENYYLALTDGKVPQYLVNSVIVTFVSVGLIVLLSVMMSYGFTRMKWKMSKVFLNIVLLGFMIPIHATLLSNFITFSRLNIQDSPIALIIPYVAFNLPQATFIMTGFMDTIPNAIEESALMDGCGIIRLLFTIVFPVLKPAIMTVIITSFINVWNEFIMAATYLTSDRFRTLPFSIYNFAGMYSSNYSAQFAVMTLSALPSLVAYVILNKHITKGIAAGAVKG
ncbi:MAG: carbohydrate ABC transporter permease [Clostridiaceae bacterium]|nr:carbohydrate ABC transporter permease [Clostridiaceae bacterium]